MTGCPVTVQVLAHGAEIAEGTPRYSVQGGVCTRDTDFPPGYVVLDEVPLDRSATAVEMVK